MAVEPFLQGLVEALHFSAGLRMVGPGVVEPDPGGVAGDLEGDPAAAAGCAGEHRPVVRQQPLRVPVLTWGVAETQNREWSSRMLRISTSVWSARQ